MSSIFGICNSSKKPLDGVEIRLMRDELNYWNSDVSDVWSEGRVALGCLLLYNTPESLTEKLPFFERSAKLAITADARIDNREELYPLLGINTQEEKEISDSRLILLSYKKYGKDCVEHLIGDFAFSIWDELQQHIFCARDQMGVKPFFYYANDRFFSFATEKKGILCLPGVDKTIDKGFFANQLFQPCIQAADATIYKNIRRLPPAHSLIYLPNSGKLQISQYWTLDTSLEYKLKNKDDYYYGLRHHFENAVKCRLRSCYPIGAELSGGIDSSSITGAASHFLNTSGRNIITFTNSFNRNLVSDELVNWEDEKKYAEEVIRFNNITEFVFVTNDIWPNIIDKVNYTINTNDGLEMRSQMWLLPIKQAAMQRNVRTLLSGFPGDEMVTYRGSYHFLEYLDKKQFLQYFNSKFDPVFKLKPFLSPKIEYALHKLKNLYLLHDEKTKQIFKFFKLPPSYRFRMGDVAWRDLTYLERFKSYKHFQKHRLLKPQVALRMDAETRFGLNFKVEPRYPMADIRLTQFYLSMPDIMKSEGPLSRTTYRIAMEKYLPEKILKRDNKSGMIAPFVILQRQGSDNKNEIQAFVNNIQNKYIKEGINLLKYKRKYLNASSIEILMWFENNFENL